jgi:hypothetical protein
LKNNRKELILKPKKEIKPGMLCVVSGAKITPQINGRFVTVIRPAVIGELFPMNGGSLMRHTLRDGEVGQYWVVTSTNPLPWMSWGGMLYYGLERVVGEPFLIPIEDSDGEDEMISIAGKPPSVTLDKPKEIA